MSYSEQLQATLVAAVRPPADRSRLDRLDGAIGLWHSSGFDRHRHREAILTMLDRTGNPTEEFTATDTQPPVASSGGEHSVRWEDDPSGTLREVDPAVREEVRADVDRLKREGRYAKLTGETKICEQCDGQGYVATTCEACQGRGIVPG